ncbi:MAG: helix-turn-helix transcriptional regulator [Bacteroidetes bacterium]|nr:helix-turn-helix transcriptional regulator [Bacteroidota bacterium]MBN8703779.1 helix-turn-helix transcriptional regulator [Bacteroidota bacterium]
MVLTIGDRITIVRKQRKLTLADIALKTGITEDVMHSIELDVYIPSLTEIIKITDVLDVSLDFIAGRISQNIDTNWLDKFDDIQAMNADNKELLITTLDVLIRQDKAKYVYNETDKKLKIKKVKIA